MVSHLYMTNITDHSWLLNMHNGFKYGSFHILVLNVVIHPNQQH